MTDKEIIEWLEELKPDTLEQRRKINKAILMFCKKEEQTDIDEFFKTLMYDEVESKPVARVYKYYTDWCAENGHDPMSKIKFSKLVMKEFKVKSITVWNYDKAEKMYKMI